MHALRFFTIDCHQKLRVVRAIAGKEPGQVFFFTSAAFANYLLDYFIEVRQRVARLIQNFKLESAEVA